MSTRAKYHQARDTPSDINEHLRVFVKLCLELEAKQVIELGTRGGVSTIAWLYAMEQTGGHVWSVDIAPAPELEHGQWTFVQGNDLEPATLAQLPDRADIVFIDTSHDYGQTLAELNVYLTKVRPGGRMLLHDTAVRRIVTLKAQPPFPVRRAVDDFCAGEGLSVEYLPNNNGLAIVTIPD